MKWQTWLYILAVVVAALAASAAEIIPPSERATSVYWSDADSGRLDGEPFRLANVDAPEKGGVGAIGGAKCEKERERAFAAKEFIVELTRNADVRISKSYGMDKYDREVVDISVDGKDLAALGLDAGVYKPWPHKGQRALSRKPDWCGVMVATR